jgi:Amidase
MATWIHRFDLPDPVPEGVMRIAVKDAIDVAGVVTTAGCIAVRYRALPAPADASCLAGVRAAAALIVGKTTLTDLCLGPEGFNPVFGTPVDPLAPQCIPGRLVQRQRDRCRRRRGRHRAGHGHRRIHPDSGRMLWDLRAEDNLRPRAHVRGLAAGAQP